MEPILWLVVFLVLIVIEAITLGLTTIWMAGGALVAAAASALGAQIWLQFVLFVAVSVVLFVFTRPIAVKHFNKERTKTNVEEMAGKHAVVTEAIDNLRGTGQVEVSGMQWTARSSQEGITIDKGREVEIVEVRGVKVICKVI